MKGLHPTNVDQYLAHGCGRCSLGNTPECKVHSWGEVLRALRGVVLEFGLTEEVKWSMPCYSFAGGKVLMVVAFKGHAAVNFLKGTLLQDPKEVLISPGENSQAVRYLSFHSPEEVRAKEATLRGFIHQAIELEKAGAKVVMKDISEHEVPEELERRLVEDPELAAAFRLLTPGRQRGYLLHFGAPKQAKTREARIDKCRQQILDGKGMFD